MSDDDDPGLCPGDCYVGALCVVSEAHTPCRVCPDEADDHEVSLLSLGCIYGADLDLSVVVFSELPGERRVLSSVWRKHQHSGRASVLLVYFVEEVLHCVRLHFVGRAAAVVGLLSAAMDVEHSVAWVAFLGEFACVLGA